MPSISRSRGYGYERVLVKRFDTYEMREKGWRAKRLGEASTNLPDAIITYSNEFVKQCYLVECKTSTANFIDVERVKFDTFYDMADVLDEYLIKYIICYKFMSKTRSNTRRKIEEKFYDVTEFVKKNLTKDKKMREDFIKMKIYYKGGYSLIFEDGVKPMDKEKDGIFLTEIK